MKDTQRLLQLAHRDFPLESKLFHSLTVDGQVLVLTILLPPRWLQIYIDEADMVRPLEDVWCDVVQIVNEHRQTILSSELS